ncbi:type II toxin-antitoxin system prevent-host-death family antitoxin [Novosphingobium sp. NBM11]|uniref:type II toxin-antitoxin system prevent-host-death family antitoxin n=1 Tax=Novosphingobium sp. NBM11 TaxID=2596914 RepID=UPI00189280B5|nr:type II toxin-antitoxin system prevent-host-death family antitoxin [Novosphingobium sp. NBM11]MBF5089083.1 type II toxin-antitoxin system prevent-host-death family antitoxin [Novosphingobium sp. NBM11]
MPNSSVSSVEFQKAVGHFGREAMRAPLTITNHGRASLVLMSAAEYDRLKRRDRQVLTMDDFTDEDRAAVVASKVPSEAAAFDSELDA